VIPTIKQWKKWSLPSKLGSIGTYVGIFSFVISFIIILIENIELKKESVFISIGEFIEDTPIEWTEGYGNHLPYQLTFTFPITIINDGLKPFTIRNYELSPFNCAYEYYTFRGKDGDKGLFRSPLDTLPIILPFSIKPGEGLTLYLKTAIAVGHFSLFDRGEARIQKLNPTLFDLKIASTLANRSEGSEVSIGESYDFFGNRTEYGIGVRGIMDISHTNPDSLNQPVYQIEFISSKDNSFKALISPYPHENTYPYDKCEDIIPFDRNDDFYQIEIEEYDRYTK
jgi:hypothetical protein